MKSIIYLGSVMLVTSCFASAKPQTARVKSPQTVIVNKGRAIKIAQQAVKANDNWANRAKYEASREGTNWSVLAQRIEGYDKKGRPQFVPGGYRVIIINKSGRVIKYIRGH